MADNIDDLRAEAARQLLEAQSTPQGLAGLAAGRRAAAAQQAIQQLGNAAPPAFVGPMQPPIPAATPPGDAAPPPGPGAAAPLPGSSPAATSLPGPTVPLLNGMTASMPQMSAATTNGPLDALREQMGVINQLVGTPHQQPVVRDQITNNSPTFGLMALGGRGGMVGPQVQGGITANQGDLANLHSYDQAQTVRGQNVGQLLGRLGTMGNQAIQGGQLSLDAIRTLAPGGTLDQGRDAPEARASASVRESIQSYMDTHPGRTMSQAYQALANDMGVSVDRIRMLHTNTMPGGAVTGGSGGRPGTSTPPVPIIPTGAATGTPQAAATPPAGVTSPQTAREAFERYVSQFAPQGPADRNGRQGARLASNFNALPLNQEANGQSPAGRVQHIRDFINGLASTNSPALTSDIHNLMPILQTEFGASDEGVRQLMEQGHAGSFFGGEGPSERAQNALAAAIRGRNPRAISNHNNLLGSGSYRLATNLTQLLAPNAPPTLPGEGLSRGPGFLGFGGLDTTNPGVHP